MIENACVDGMCVWGLVFLCFLIIFWVRYFRRLNSTRFFRRLNSTNFLRFPVSYRQSLDVQCNQKAQTSENDLRSV